jgi:aryl-alcohol dehydrogenase-like predicted oxidoreductase
MGVGVIPWSPLARGWLTGSRNRSGERHTSRSKNDNFANQLYDDSDFDVVDAVTALAAERDLPPAQIALAWLLHKQGVAATIVGATKVGHLGDALAALDVRLSDAELHRLEERYRPHPVRGLG